MGGCRKKSIILQMVTFLICMMFLVPGLIFADEKEDPATVAKRKAALAAALGAAFLEAFFVAVLVFFVTAITIRKY